MGCRAVAWLLVASVSCGGGDPFVGDVSRSRYFEYHDQVTEPLCPILLDRLDQHEEMIGGKIGLNPDAHNPYRYFKFRDLAALTAAGSRACGAHSGGCSFGNSLDAFTYFEAHEQSHGYTYRAWGGWSNGLLDEGLAVAMSCEPLLLLEPNQKPTDVVGVLDWRNLLHLPLEAHGYRAAGFFVTHLANLYGWQGVGAFYKKVPGGASADDVARAFESVFPTTIDQAWSDALGTPGAPLCQMDWKCMATPMAVGDVATPDCDGEMHRSLDFVGADGVVLSMEGGYDLKLFPCGDPAPIAYEFASGSAGRPTTHWASLPTGSYTFLSDVVPTTVTLQSKFSGPLVGGDCATALSVTLAPNATSYIDLLPGIYSGWMHLAGGGNSYGVATNSVGQYMATTLGTGVTICTDCTATSCVEIAFGQVAQMTIGDQAVVQFQRASAQPGHAGMFGQVVFFGAPTN